MKKKIVIGIIESGYRVGWGVKDLKNIFLSFLKILSS